MKKGIGLGLLVLSSLAAPALADAPYTLRAAVARALQTHPDLAISRAEAQKALLALDDARAQGILLNASLSAAEVHAQSNIGGDGGAKAPSNVPSANGTINLTIPLFTGWKETAGIDAASKGLDAADADREEARQSLELSVIEAFWNLRKAELIERSQHTLLDQAQRALEQTRAQVSVGRRSRDDVDQAEISVLAAQSELLELRGQTAQARAQLARLLGVGADSLAITGEPDASPADDLDAMASLPAALRLRPDALAAKFRVGAADAAYVAAKGDRWPQLALSTSYQHGNLAANPVTGVQEVGSFAGTWQAQIGASYDLFDMGKVGRTIDRADLDRQEARARLTKVSLQVGSELEQAVAAARSAASRIGIGRRQVDLAREHLEFVQSSYLAGFALELEVADARDKLLSAVDQRVQALIDYQIAIAQLRRAAGLL